jgi:hypothetical protein
LALPGSHGAAVGAAVGFAVGAPVRAALGASVSAAVGAFEEQMHRYLEHVVWMLYVLTLPCVHEPDVHALQCR